MLKNVKGEKIREMKTRTKRYSITHKRPTYQKLDANRERREEKKIDENKP